MTKILTTLGLTSMKSKLMICLLWLGTAALTVATFFGYRCPAQRCPACKMLGK